MRNETRRPREYLTVKEVELLMESARTRGRYGHRDATMILIAFRHGLRPAEVCALRWDMIDLGQGLLHVRRVKNGTPSVQPLGGGELRALRAIADHRKIDAIDPLLTVRQLVHWERPPSSA